MVVLVALATLIKYLDDEEDYRYISLFLYFIAFIVILVMAAFVFPTCTNNLFSWVTNPKSWFINTKHTSVTYALRHGNMIAHKGLELQYRSFLLSC